MLSFNDKDNKISEQWCKERMGQIVESTTKTYTLPYVKQIISGNFLYDAGHTNPGLCDNWDGQDGVGGGKESEVAQSCSTLCDPMDYTPQAPLSMGRIREWVAISFSRGSSQPRIEPRSPTLQADSLPSVPSGKPREGEKEVQKGGYMCIPMADFYWCMAETNIIL